MRRYHPAPLKNLWTFKPLIKTNRILRVFMRDFLSSELFRFLEALFEQRGFPDVLVKGFHEGGLRGQDVRESRAQSHFFREPLVCEQIAASDDFRGFGPERRD